MHNNRTPTLVLMRASEEDGLALFAGDLYVGRSLQTSVYHSRSAMLDWLGPFSSEVRSAAVIAMDQLVASSDVALRSIPLGSLPVPAQI